MDHVPYVIIGGGLAGVAAADAIRRRDKTGQLMLICAEPHPPYDRVPLSKGYLLGEIERDQVFLRPSRFYERNKVELVLGQAATALDLSTRQITLADGRSLGFEKLLLATGGDRASCPSQGLISKASTTCAISRTRTPSAVPARCTPSRRDWRIHWL